MIQKSSGSWKTYHYFKNRTFFPQSFSWRSLSHHHQAAASTIFRCHGAWRCRRHLRRQVGVAIFLWSWFDSTDQIGVHFFQRVYLQEIIEPVFTHLKLEPLGMRVERRFYYFHKLRFFDPEPITDRNLKKEWQKQTPVVCWSFIRQNQKKRSKLKNIVTCSIFARSFKGRSFPGVVPSGWSKTNKVSFNVFSKDWSLAAKGPKWEHATFRAPLWSPALTSFRNSTCTFIYI